MTTKSIGIDVFMDADTRVTAKVTDSTNATLTIGSWPNEVTLFGDAMKMAVIAENILNALREANQRAEHEAEAYRSLHLESSK